MYLRSARRSLRQGRLLTVVLVCAVILVCAVAVAACGSSSKSSSSSASSSSGSAGASSSAGSSASGSISASTLNALGAKVQKAEGAPQFTAPGPPTNWA